MCCGLYSRPDLTWVACVPNLSSAPKRGGNAGQASSAGASQGTLCSALSVHQDVARQGRLVAQEVERSSTSSQVA
jgi:hypothetical protein